MSSSVSPSEFNPLNPDPIIPGDLGFIGTMQEILQCTPSSLCACVQNSFNSLSTAGYGAVSSYDIAVFESKSIGAGDFVLAIFGEDATFALPILADVQEVNYNCSSYILEASTFPTTAYHSLFRDLLNITDVTLSIGAHLGVAATLKYLTLSGLQSWGGLLFDTRIDLIDETIWTFDANYTGDIDLVSFVNDAFNANFPTDPINTPITLTDHTFTGIVDVAAGYEFYLVIRGTLHIGNWFRHDVHAIVHHILSGRQNPNVFIMTGVDGTLTLTLDSLIASLSGVDISGITFFNSLNLDNFHISFATPNFVISDSRLSQLDQSSIPSAIPNNLVGLQFVFDLSVPTLGDIKRWALTYSSLSNTAVFHPVSTSDDRVPLTDMLSLISSNTLIVPSVPLVETDVTNFSVEEVSLPIGVAEARVMIFITHVIEIIDNLIEVSVVNITFPVSLDGSVTLGPYIIGGHFDTAQVRFTAAIKYNGSSYQCRGQAEGFPSGVTGLLDIFKPGLSIRDIVDFLDDPLNSVRRRRQASTNFGSTAMKIVDILIDFLPDVYPAKICWDGTLYSGQYVDVRGALCIFDFQDYTFGFDVSDFVMATFLSNFFGDPVYHFPFFNQQLDTILVYSSFDNGQLPWTSHTYKFLEEKSILKGVSFYTVSSWPDTCTSEFCIEAQNLLGAEATFHLYTYIRSFDHLLLQAGLDDFKFGQFKVTHALLVVEFKKPNVFIGINGTIEIPEYEVRLDGAIQLRYPNLQIIADFTLNSTQPTCSDITRVIFKDKPPSILKRVKIDFCYAYLYARLGHGVARPSANIGGVVGIGDRSCYRLELAAFAGFLNPKSTSNLNPTEFKDRYILAEARDKITLLSIIDMLFCTKLSGSLLSFFLDIGLTSGFTVSLSTVEYTVPQTGLYIRKGFYIRGSFKFLWHFHVYGELHFDPPDVIDLKLGLPPVVLARGLIKLVESRTNDAIGPSVRFVLRNIPSFNFLLELSGYARVLGIEAEGKLSISDKLTKLYIAGKIFGVLSAELTVYTNYGKLLSVDWGVKGVLKSNILKAIEDAVVAVIKGAGRLKTTVSSGCMYISTPCTECDVSLLR